MKCHWTYLPPSRKDSISRIVVCVRFCFIGIFALLFKGLFNFLFFFLFERKTGREKKHEVGLVRRWEGPQRCLRWEEDDENILYEKQFKKKAMCYLSTCGNLHDKTITKNTDSCYQTTLIWSMIQKLWYLTFTFKVT